MVFFFVILLTFAASASGQVMPRVQLRPETTQAFEDYAKGREAGILSRRINGGKFLWADDTDDRRARVRGGEVVIEPFRERGVIEVTGGILHDWIGAVFVANTTLSKVLSTVQNYDSHKNLYQPEVNDSRLLSREGNLFRVRMRLFKKKVITTVLNTDHEITYFPLDAIRQHSRSRSTRIAEVEGAGGRGEHELSPGDDHGLLWNLNSYWRFLERDGGVWIECEAISLTRGIPTGFGWLLTPIVRELPRESLTHTLEATRRALR